MIVDKSREYRENKAARLLLAKLIAAEERQDRPDGMKKLPMKARHF